MKLVTDWRIYQVRINGVDKLVGDLTTDELRLTLCQSIDALEDVDAAISASSERIDSWRNGRCVPTKPSAAERKPRRTKKASS